MFTMFLKVRMMPMLVMMVRLMSPEGEYVEVFDKRRIGGGLETACERISKVDYWNRNF